MAAVKIRFLYSFGPGADSSRAGMGIASHTDPGGGLNPSIAVRASSSPTLSPLRFRSRRDLGGVLISALQAARDSSSSALNPVELHSVTTEFVSRIQKRRIHRARLKLGRDALDYSGFGVLLDVVIAIKDSSEVANNDEMGCVSIFSQIREEDGHPYETRMG